MLLHRAHKLVLECLLGLANALRRACRCKLHMEAAPRRCVSERNGANVAIREQPKRLCLPLLVGEHEQPVELVERRTVFHAAHASETHRERLQVLGLQVLHTADKQSALRTARLEFRVVLPEFVAHMIALVQCHLRKPATAELAHDWLWLWRHGHRGQRWHRRHHHPTTWRCPLHLHAVAVEGQRRPTWKGGCRTLREILSRLHLLAEATLRWQRGLRL
mmetsp:Transcript_19994/g.52588  ORF Transcript_19994/g.52588 Transcript_19994/m.52588 type:complete len:219 (-) Transcript_19994:310-966(-)